MVMVMVMVMEDKGNWENGPWEQTESGAGATKSSRGA